MTGTIIEVDPKDLTIALNVRTDTKLDSDFLASVKELGILQPPMVTKTDDGGYEVILGQRRTLAAVQVGLAKIPVYLVDQDAADAARVIDQITENDQRASLSEAERIGGYKQLALFGISPAQIAKKTARPRAVIDAALAVADNATATQALAEHELTLDQAAVLVEFADDPEAVQTLIRHAGGGFNHAAARLREDRAVQQEIDQLTAELAAEVAHVFPVTNSTWVGPALAKAAGFDEVAGIDGLGMPGNPTEPLTFDAVPAEARGGRVIDDWIRDENNEWKRARFKQYLVIDPAKHGIPDLEHVHREAEPLTEEEQQAQAERTAAEQARVAKHQARKLAAEVRQTWIKELLQRTKLPAQAQQNAFIARTACRVCLDDPDDAFALLGHDNINPYREAERNDALTLLENPKIAGAFPLALALTECEATASHAWVDADDYDLIDDYFRQLTTWGYTLSDAEQELLVELAGAVDEATDLDDDEDFEEDDE